MADKLKKVREALERAVPQAITEIDIGKFKETSFFMSNSKKVKTDETDV